MALKLRSRECKIGECYKGSRTLCCIIDDESKCPKKEKRGVLTVECFLGELVWESR
jgi:hypothetical protein